MLLSTTFQIKQDRQNTKRNMLLNAKKKKTFNIKQNNYFAIISNANCSGEKEKEKS